MFFTEMKRRKLGRLVRQLDHMVAGGGEDRRLATTCP